MSHSAAEFFQTLYYTYIDPDVVAPVVVSMNQTNATEFELKAGAEQNFKNNGAPGGSNHTSEFNCIVWSHAY